MAASKKPKKLQFTVYPERDLYEHLKALAASEDRTLSATVKRLLRETMSGAPDAPQRSRRGGL